MYTHNIELVFALLVFDVFVDFFEATRKGTPAFRHRTVPDEHITLVASGGYRRFMRMPLWYHLRCMCKRRGVKETNVEVDQRFSPAVKGIRKLAVIGDVPYVNLVGGIIRSTY